MKTRLQVILFTASLISSAALNAAQTGGAFLKIDPSARSYALGQSGAVAALGAESIGTNPANLMDMSRKMELMSAYSSISEDVSYAHIAGAVNRSMNKNLLVDAIGFSYTRLSVGGIDGRDSGGNKTADFGSVDSQMSMSLSGNAGKMKLGLTGKVVQSKIGEYKANTAFAGDFGMSWGFRSLGRNITAGASVSNFGQGIKYINQKDALPTTLNLGLGTAVGPLNLMGGLKQEFNGKTAMNMGVEFNAGMVSLRAGMNALSGNKGNKTSNGFDGLSSGVGFRIGNTRMDYAIGQASADLGVTQRLSLTLQFGRKPE